MTDAQRKQINSCLAEIAKGNEFALDALSRLVSARMYSVAMSVVRDRSTAEDVVQDSFLRIVQSASSFRPDTNGYAWICKITQNVALNYLRRESRYRTENIDDFFFLSDDDDVEQLSTATLLVRDAMSVLTEFEKRVVYQKYFMDLTVRDIAQSLHKSKSAVQRAIASGEEKMKNYLKSGTKPPV